MKGILRLRADEGNIEGGGRVKGCPVLIFSGKNENKNRGDIKYDILPV